MNYFSTRDKSKKFSFKEVFLRGLAPDGGLFVPENLKEYSSKELEDLKKLNYVQLATEIVSLFCGSDISKKRLKQIIEKSYYEFLIENVVSLKTFDNLNILELYHGPTLAFKDIAMQVIGNLYVELKKTKMILSILL